SVPFPRDSEAAVMFAHLKEPAPHASSRRPGLPEGVDAVVARAMAKRPEDRYPSAVALAEDLRKAARGDPVEVSAPRPRILVVDDLPQNARLLEAVLVPNGYLVITASSGPEALEM